MKTGPRAPGACAAALTLALSAWSSLALAQNSDVPGPAAPTASAPAPAPPSPAAPGTAAPAEATPGTGNGAASNAGGAYTVRLHDLERRTDELKEMVYRSKARLNLLKETVLHTQGGVSRALITHRNEMGSTYTLVKLVYSLDGAEIFAKSDESGQLGEAKEFEIFNGALVPGNHTLSVTMVYQGNGFGVFSYLKGYKFTVRGSHTFAAAETKQSQLKVVGFEQGNPITTDPKDRPAIDFRMNIVADKPTGIPDNANNKPADAPVPEANH